MRSFCKHLEDRITIEDIKICCQLGNSYQEKNCFDVYQQIPTYEDASLRKYGIGHSFINYFLILFDIGSFDNFNIYFMNFMFEEIYFAYNDLFQNP